METRAGIHFALFEEEDGEKNMGDYKEKRKELVKDLLVHFTDTPGALYTRLIARQQMIFSNRNDFAHTPDRKV